MDPYLARPRPAAMFVYCRIEVYLITFTTCKVGQYRKIMHTMNPMTQFLVNVLLVWLVVLPLGLVLSRLNYSCRDIPCQQVVQLHKSFLPSRTHHRLLLLHPQCLLPLPRRNLRQRKLENAMLLKIRRFSRMP